DWSVDPFTFLEKDGYFYGRGTTDDKVGDAILVADFIRLKQKGFKPRRDLILVLTGDEETAGSCIAWLVAKHRDLIDADFALNTDAGGGVLRDGQRVMFVVQASEKVYATYVLEATDKGGHSSLPRPADNPVYRLAPVLAPHPGEHGSHRAAGRGAVPPCPDRAGDGSGRDRRAVPPQRGDPHVRRLGRVRGAKRRARPRAR